MDYRRLPTTRAYEPADAPALAALYAESVRVLGPMRYSVQQVEAWIGMAPDAAALRRRYAQGYSCLIMEKENGVPIAFGDLRGDGLIGYFYGHPDHTRSGATVALCEALEDRARRMGLVALRVEASELAKSFFDRRGFALLRRQDFLVGPVEIHNYLMEKPLIAGTAA